MKVHVEKSSLTGSVAIPGSKSHAIRALLIATLADGISYIRQPLESSDTRSCLGACRALGAEITESESGGLWTVKGTGGKVATPENIIDTGNSGTTLYLAASLAALQPNWAVFTGDCQIRKRPFKPLLDSLNDLGAQAFDCRGNGCAPAAVKGRLKGGRTSIECPTSQYLSSLLISCPLAEGESVIDLPLLREQPYVEMTLAWLDSQKIRYENQNFKRFIIPGNQSYKAFDRIVPADFSSATFFLCAAAVTGAELTLTGLDMADSQGDKVVVSMLEKMGCLVEVSSQSLTIKGGRLQGQVLDLNDTPDALPALAVTACFAEGETRLVNVPNARLKETDRIAVMARELTKLGADISEFPDGLVIRKSDLKGTEVQGHDDHRVVMALCLAGLGSKGTTIIDSAEAAAVTFPQYFDLIRSLGGNVH